jgi:ribosomal protein S18 acetylase RimI-like enzyme
VSQITQGMLAQGVVEQRKVPGDERKSGIALTDDGRALVPQLAPLWQAIRSAVDELIAETGTDLLSTLSRLERSLDAESLTERALDRLRESDLERVELFAYEPENAAHRAAFRALNSAWIRKYFVIEPGDEAVFADPEGQILAPGGAVLFAALNGEIVGTCALLLHGGEVELAKMAVDPKAQGKHIGKKLMLAALDRARALGFKRIVLQTNDTLTPAVNLYRSVGFKPDAQIAHGDYARVNLTMSMQL